MSFSVFLNRIRRSELRTCSDFQPCYDANRSMNTEDKTEDWPARPLIIFTEGACFTRPIGGAGSARPKNQRLCGLPEFPFELII